MTEKQRQRVERRVNIMPYTTASWDPLQDLSLSGSTVWDQVTQVDGHYRIFLDVKHFSPDEIKVRTVGDVVEIEGSHDEKQDDHGVISRNFTRKYTLPKEVDPLTVTSFVSPNAILTVEAPLRTTSTEHRPKTLTVKHS